MRVLSRADLASWLAEAGIERATMDWRPDEPLSRLLIREAEPLGFESGPHRVVPLPGEESPLKLPLADRPALSGFVADIFAGAPLVCAAVPGGSYWLNNRGYAAYLRKVPDAQRVHTMLRCEGLTDRFRGGFLIRPHEFGSRLPLLASQAFCGGPDVYFASLSPPLLVMACHEFDLHVETPDAAAAHRIRAVAVARGLPVAASPAA